MALEFKTLKFFNYFSELEDPRIDRKKLYSLEEILLTTVCAVICGAESWQDISDFGEARISYLKKFLPYKNGIPSHDTFGRLFSMLDPESFRKCFIQWMQSFQKELSVIAIDGKTVRRSFDKIKDKKPIHVISAFASNVRLVMGQKKVNSKTNEITEIPKLLDLLFIKDSIITIDAMGCQKEIANKIIEKKANYILALKGNHGDLYEDVKTYLQEEKNLKFYKDVDKGHGRIEIRKCFATNNIEWLSGKKKWKNLKTILMIESTRITRDKESKEIRFYISSLEPDPEKLLKAVRSHWAIENNLHWVLDMTFREDESRIRKKNAPENMAIIRHIVLNMLKKAETKNISIRRRRKKAGWSNEYLENVLKQKF